MVQERPLGAPQLLEPTEPWPALCRHVGERRQEAGKGLTEVDTYSTCNAFFLPPLQVPRILPRFLGGIFLRHAACSREA